MSDDFDEFFGRIWREFFGHPIQRVAQRADRSPIEQIKLDNAVILVQDLNNMYGIEIDHQLINDKEHGRCLHVFSEDGRYDKLVPFPESEKLEYDVHLTNGILEIIFRKK
jgi:hypothetical protein